MPRRVVQNARFERFQKHFQNSILAGPGWFWLILAGSGCFWLVLINPQPSPVKKEEHEFKAEFRACLNQTGMKLIWNWECGLQPL